MSRKLVTHRMDEMAKDLAEIKGMVKEAQTARTEMMLRAETNQQRLAVLEAGRQSGSSFVQGALLQIVPIVFSGIAAAVIWLVLQMTTNGGTTP